MFAVLSFIKWSLKFEIRHSKLQSQSKDHHVSIHKDRMDGIRQFLKRKLFLTFPTPLPSIWQCPVSQRPKLMDFGCFRHLSFAVTLSTQEDITSVPFIFISLQVLARLANPTKPQLFFLELCILSTPAYKTT